MHHYKTLESITANWSCFYRTTISRTTSDHLEPWDTINLLKTVVAVCLKEYAAVQNWRFFFSGKDSSCGLQGYDNVSLVYGYQHFKGMCHLQLLRRFRQYIPWKYWYQPTRLFGAITQKTTIWIAKSASGDWHYGVMVSTAVICGVTIKLLLLS